MLGGCLGILPPTVGKGELGRLRPEAGPQYTCSVSRILVQGGMALGTSERTLAHLRESSSFCRFSQTVRASPSSSLAFFFAVPKSERTDVVSVVSSYTVPCKQ